MKKIQLLHLVIILILIVPCLSQSITLIEKDKFTIVNNILKHTNLQPDSNLPEKIIYLSTIHLPDNFFIEENKTFDGIKIKLLKPAQIKQMNVRAKAPFFEYYYFKSFAVMRKEVRISFIEYERSGVGTQESGSLYICKKINRNWKCRLSAVSLSEN